MDNILNFTGLEAALKIAKEDIGLIHILLFKLDKA
jgi:hypothetical protein